MSVDVEMEEMCTKSATCDWLNVCLGGVCTHKGLLPLAGEDVVLGLVIFLFTGIANAAGISGASVLVPISILIGHFGAHTAIPLISATSFGGICIAVVMRVQLRHLVVDKPRIDYDVAMHLCMPMMLGAVGGVMLNIVLPGWVILGLLLVVLGYSAYSIFERAIHVQRLGNVQESFVERIAQDTSSELMEIYREEAKLAPRKQLTWVCVMLFIVSLFVFLRGGKGIESILGFETCSPGYWVTTSLFTLICVFFMWLTSTSLINKTVYYKYIEYPYCKGDFQWNQRQCLLVISGGLFAGVMSGLFGIAGGVILIPILLSLKMRPEVANATCSFLTFFTNFTTFLQFAAAGMIKYGYAGTYCILAMLGSLLGVFLLEKLVRRMQSVTIYLLGAIMVIAFTLIPVYEVKHMISQVETGLFPGFNSLCSVQT